VPVQNEENAGTILQKNQDVFLFYNSSLTSMFLFNMQVTTVYIPYMIHLIHCNGQNFENDDAESECVPPYV
jgi:hypothetical protein